MLLPDDLLCIKQSISLKASQIVQDHFFMITTYLH